MKCFYEQVNIINNLELLMTMYGREEHSTLKSQGLQINSKVQSKEDSENQQVLKLCAKIGQMEKNFIAMQKYYADKIKMMYGEISEKDLEFRRMQAEMQEIRLIASEHKKKVEDLNKNAHKKTTTTATTVTTETKMKSKSPVITSRNPKATVNNEQTQISAKSPSPKNEPKKVSPSHKLIQKKTTVLTKKSEALSKQPISKEPAVKQPVLKQPITSMKNISGEMYAKKSMSPKHSYEKSKKLLGRVEDAESMKLIKKPGTGISSFREKDPTYK